MLGSNEDKELLFEVTDQIKDFYETSVIFITGTDYSDQIFNALCSIRTALNNWDRSRLIDVIVEFHFQWLLAVTEIENFRDNFTENSSRDEVYQAICFTIEALDQRLKYYQSYMEKYRPGLSNAEQSNLQTDLEIVEEMHNDVKEDISDSLKCFKSYVCFDEFKVKINEAVDELLSWLDKNYDGLALRVSNYMHVPNLKENLSIALQKIVDELLSDKYKPHTVEMLNQLKKKGKDIGTLIRRTVGHSLEIRKITEKIHILEDQIESLAEEPNSAPVKALKHKKEYLEKRTAEIETLKTNLETIQNLTSVKIKDDKNVCICLDFYQLKVFNHILPRESRESLVTDLCALWDLAVFGERSHQSIIPILNAVDVKEEYTDDLGTFFIDKHSRKIYRSPDDETLLLQPNEYHELVPVSDDIDHVYYYDECGRYFIDPTTRERIYKAHATASEFRLDSTGVLLKVKEVRDGTVYYYDKYGRYYINEKGNHIYKEEGHSSEYESDELGNIVRIRSQLDIFQPCPDDAQVTEDFKYLKEVVGPALRACTADVLLHQPADPIKYLAMALVKFRENIELKEKRSREKEELNAEREIIAAEARAEAERLAIEAMTQGGSEASYDSNLIKYTSMVPDELVSAGPPS